jgi:hypothetical protein
VRAAAGIGKSRAVINALQAHPQAQGKHIDILVPHNTGLPTSWPWKRPAGCSGCR